MKKEIEILKDSIENLKIWNSDCPRDFSDQSTGQPQHIEVRNGIVLSIHLEDISRTFWHFRHDKPYEQQNKYRDFIKPLENKHKEVSEYFEKIKGQNPAKDDEYPYSKMDLLRIKVGDLVSEMERVVDAVTVEPENELKDNADKNTTRTGREQGPTKTLASGKSTTKKRRIPRGYIGSQTIINSSVKELKEQSKLPVKQGDEKYKIPRATLEYWQQRDDKPGGELEGNIKRDPKTNEVYYPNKWLKKRILTYKPKDRNS